MVSHFDPPDSDLSHRSNYYGSQTNPRNLFDLQPLSKKKTSHLTSHSGHPVAHQEVYSHGHIYEQSSKSCHCELCAIVYRGE